jgi:hypothetical protein
VSRAADDDDDDDDNHYAGGWVSHRVCLNVAKRKIPAQNVPRNANQGKFFCKSDDRTLPCSHFKGSGVRFTELHVSSCTRPGTSHRSVINDTGVTKDRAEDHKTRL